ncbi:MAG: FecR domain-containing protein, partial [Candidatus Omnitrophica bacterium]|nr:FecR domain-containing protein [Candidatus Omnitrophota bacterium]
NKIELKPKSRLKMTTLEMDAITGEKITLLDLAIGKVLVHASKLQGESKFEVRTPTSTTGVRGTVFEVSVEEA